MSAFAPQENRWWCWTPAAGASRYHGWRGGAWVSASWPVGANLAHGVGHGPVGALVSAWPALALVGSFELLMMPIRTGRGSRAGDAELDPSTSLYRHWHKKHRWNS